MQLTDDKIDEIISKITDKVEDLVYQEGLSDIAFYELEELIQKLLEPFSNGYRNHN